jgi:hypothetical protein
MACDKEYFVPALILRFPYLWQAIGWLCVIGLVVITLVPSPPQPPVVSWDKAQHGLAYTALMLWFAQAFRARHCWLGFLLGLGVILEFLQSWTGYRHFDFGDMLANTVGVLSGLLLSFTPLGMLVIWLDRWLALRLDRH